MPDSFTHFTIKRSRDGVAGTADTLGSINETDPSYTLITDPLLNGSPISYVDHGWPTNAGIVADPPLYYQPIGHTANGLQVLYNVVRAAGSPPSPTAAGLVTYIPSIGPTATDVRVLQNIGVYTKLGFVTSQYFGLTTVNLSGTPTVLGATDLPFTGRYISVNAAGTIAVVTGERFRFSGANLTAATVQTVVFIDTSNPLKPAVKKFIDLSTPIFGVVISGNYAYVCAGSSGIQTYSIPTDLTAAALVGGATFPGFAKGIAASGSNLYVASSGSGLRVLSLSDAVNPVPKGSVSTVDSAQGVDVIGSYAYVAAFNLLKVVDISNQDQPTVVGTTSGLGNANQVKVDSGFAYFGCTGSGIATVDVSTPTNPGSAHILPVANSTPFGVAVIGSTLYSAMGNAGLGLFNVATPSAPSLSSNIGGDWFQGDYCAVDTTNNRAVIGGSRIANSTGNTFLFAVASINPTGATTPAIIGTLNVGGAVNGVAISQINSRYIFAACGASGVRVIDINTPSAPTNPVTVDTAGFARNLKTVGNYLYVADSGAGLKIIDVSDPTSPIPKGGVSTTDSAQAVDVVGDRAYVAALSVVKIINILDKDNPSVITGFPGNAVGIKIFGVYAFVASGGSGLVVKRIANDNPQDVTVFNPPNITFNGVDTLDGITLYASIVDPTIPGGRPALATLTFDGTRITAIGAAVTPGTGRIVQINSTNIYMSDQRGTISILR